MPNRGSAILQERDGRPALLFERILPHAPERVWRALTSTGELHDWHPTPFELDGSPPTAGARVRFIATTESPEMRDGELLEYDPPRLLAHTWDHDELRWEIEAQGNGSLLRLTHIFDDSLKAARDAAGWDLCLEALSSSLDGSSAPQRGEGARLPQGWSELNSGYEQRFGIPSELATPPPAR